MKTQAKKPRCKLIGTDGNIFALGAKAIEALTKAGQQEAAKTLAYKICGCRSYDEALRVIAEYVDIH